MFNRKRRPTQLYVDRGSDIPRRELVAALQSLSMALRTGQPHLAVNPYHAKSRPQWRVRFLQRQLYFYRQINIEGMKRATERRREQCAWLSALFFCSGIVIGIGLFLGGLFGPLGGVGLAAGMVFTPIAFIAASRAYLGVLEATHVRRELCRWSSCLHDARVVRARMPQAEMAA